MSRTCTLALLAAGALVFATGCKKSDTIERYTVERIVNEKPTQPETPGNDRMLAAMVPHGPQAWFFIVAGPADAVSAHRDEYLQLLKSIKFGDSPAAPPEWQLPEGWKQEPGSGLRFATLKISEKDQTLDVRVTKLPAPENPDAEYVLANVNRWRGQMKLSPLAAADLPQETTEVELADGKATMVDLAGTATPGALGRGPMMMGAGDGK